MPWALRVPTRSRRSRQGDDTDDDGCACRKPKAGMFLELATTCGLDLADSMHVGDSAKDRAAARAAGVGRFVPAREFFGWSDAPNAR
ncbi:MAG TPA: HAD hydrolase-like protein [Methylomirabilota bacterium]|nr:HAD hydrolase-like protein [Methylomirabilota bacterium]